MPTDDDKISRELSAVRAELREMKMMLMILLPSYADERERFRILFRRDKKVETEIRT